MGTGLGDGELRGGTAPAILTIGGDVARLGREEIGGATMIFGETMGEAEAWRGEAEAWRGETEA